MRNATPLIPLNDLTRDGIAHDETGRDETGRYEASGPASGGPVGAMQAALNARLTAAEYERWLLPPEPRDEVESVVHLLSLAAGVLALTCGAALVWLLI